MSLATKAIAQISAALLLALIGLTNVSLADGSLYTIEGMSGGTEVNGYYTRAPSLTVQLSASYPNQCQSSDPNYRTIVESLKPQSDDPVGTYTWELLEDLNNDALVLKDVNENYQTDLVACNWNTSDPNYQVEWQASIKYDFGSPSVSITSPSNNTNVNSNSVNVSGTATEAASDISSVSVNGVSAVLSGSSFSAQVPLEQGLNTIVATATDGVGHQAQSSQVTVFRGENGSKEESATTGNNPSGQPGSSVSPNPSKTEIGITSARSPMPSSAPKPEGHLGSVKLTGDDIKNTGLSLAGFLILIIVFLVLDRLGIIEIRLFSNYGSWRKRHYLKQDK